MTSPSTTNGIYNKINSNYSLMFKARIKFDINQDKLFIGLLSVVSAFSVLLGAPCFLVGPLK